MLVPYFCKFTNEKEFLSGGFGRVSNRYRPGDKPIAPSEIPYRWNPEVICRAISTEEVVSIVRAIGQAALIAKNCGFDGIELGDYLFPRLTTIRQPVDRLAMRGVSILIHCIEESSDAIHEIVPYQFVEGESVRALTE